MDDSDPIERRRHPRILCTYRLRVAADGGGTEGYLVDLSRVGMRVRFLRDTALVAVRRLEVELPKWAGLEGNLALPGRFAWFKPASDFRGPEGGFAFDSLEPDEIARIDLVMERILKAAEEDGLLSHALSETMPGTGASLF